MRLVEYNLFVNAYCPGINFTYKCMLTYSGGLNEPHRLWDSVGSSFLKIK